MNFKAIASALVALGIVALAGWLCFGWPRVERAGNSPIGAGSRELAPADPNRAAIAAAGDGLQEREIQSRIVANLRRLARGAEEAFLNRGVSSVASSDLVGGTGSRFVDNFQAVANESYPAVITAGQGLTASDPTNRRTVTISF
jgi:hypothetical protein